MSPYEVLGVPRTATEHQIKTAYRLTAKATHPDAPGGSVEAFQDASKAYSVLMNPETRKLFDETGRIDAKLGLDARGRMVQLIADLFTQALNAEGQSGRPLQGVDLIGSMRSNMTNWAVQFKQQRDGLAKAITDRKLILSRISRPDDGQNLFADIVRSQLDQLEPKLPVANLDVVASQMAVEELKHYKSEVDLIRDIQTMQWGGMWGSSADTTSGSVWGLTR